MKINIKPKIEATDQYNLRLSVSLKKRLEALKVRANNHGADFNATLLGVIEEFATELEARFDAQEQSASSSPRTNPNILLGQSTLATPSSPSTPDSESIPTTAADNGSGPERP